MAVQNTKKINALIELQITLGKANPVPPVELDFEQARKEK